MCPRNEGTKRLKSQGTFSSGWCQSRREEASDVPTHLLTGSLQVVSPVSMRSSIQTTLVWDLLDSPCMGNQAYPQTSNSQPGVMTSHPRTPPWGPEGERVLPPLLPSHLCPQRSFHAPQQTEALAPGCKRQG